MSHFSFIRRVDIIAGKRYEDFIGSMNIKGGVISIAITHGPWNDNGCGLNKIIDMGSKTSVENADYLHGQFGNQLVHNAQGKANELGRDVALEASYTVDGKTFQGVIYKFSPQIFTNYRKPLGVIKSSESADFEADTLEDATCGLASYVSDNSKVTYRWDEMELVTDRLIPNAPEGFDLMIISVVENPQSRNLPKGVFFFAYRPEVTSFRFRVELCNIDRDGPVYILNEASNFVPYKDSRDIFIHDGSCWIPILDVDEWWKNVPHYDW